MNDNTMDKILAEEAEYRKQQIEEERAKHKAERNKEADRVQKLFESDIRRAQKKRREETLTQIGDISILTENNKYLNYDENWDELAQEKLRELKLALARLKIKEKEKIKLTD